MSELNDAEFELHLIAIQDRLEALQDLIENNPNQWNGEHYDQWNKLMTQYIKSIEESEAICDIYNIV